MNLLEGKYRIYPIECILNQDKMCLTVKDNSTRVCTQIVLNNIEANNLTQQFIFEKYNNHYVIRIVYSRLVFDILEGKRESGAKIVQYNLHVGDNQLWDISELPPVEISMLANLIPGGKELLKNKYICLIKSVMVKDYGLKVLNDTLVNSDNPFLFVIEKV